MLYYTEEEKARIIENLKMVEDYVKETMIPRLRPHESAIVFVGMNMSFFISSEGNIRFTTGGLSLSFDKDANRDSNIYDRWNYGAKLLLGWQSFKIAMNEKLDGMEKERKAIIDFHI